MAHREFRPLEVGAGQHSVVQHRTPETGPTQFCIAEVVSLEIGVGQVGPTQICVAEIGPSKVQPCQLGVAGPENRQAWIQGFALSSQCVLKYT